MRPAWWHALVALTAAVVAAFWPLTPALSSGDMLQARVGAALIAAIACGLLTTIRGWRPGVLIGLSIVSAAAGIVLLILHFNAVADCVADYDGRPMIIGREYAADAASYISANPSLCRA